MATPLVGIFYLSLSDGNMLRSGNDRGQCRLKSAMRSFTFSIPTERRMSCSIIPIFWRCSAEIIAWEVSTGSETSDFTPPRLGANANSRSYSPTFLASSPEPFTSSQHAAPPFI